MTDNIAIVVSNGGYFVFNWFEKCFSSSFLWKDKKYFYSNVLPLVLVLLDKFFTKALCEVVKFWRSKGHKVVMHLDDGIGGSQTFAYAEILS